MFDNLYKLASIYLSKVAAIRGDFSLQYFSSLPHAAGFHYAQDSLENLGHGSSRVAFILTSKKVLKIAKNQAGYIQNSKEKELYEKFGGSGLLTKVYASDSNGSWIVAELVKPLTSAEEFKKLSGIGFPELKSYINVDPAEYDDLEFELEMMGIGKQGADFLVKATSLARAGDLIKGDFAKADSWGKTADGNLVLLDYGLSNESYDKYYNMGLVRKPENDDRETKKIA